MFCLLLTPRGAFPLLVLGPVFKTGEGSGNRLLVGSIPMRSRHPEATGGMPTSATCVSRIWPRPTPTFASFRLRGLTL